MGIQMDDLERLLGPGFSSTSPDSRRQMGTKDGTHLRWVSDFVERALHRLSRLLAADCKRSLRVETMKDSREVGLNAGEKRMVDGSSLSTATTGAGLGLSALIITTRRIAASCSASLVTTAILFDFPYPTRQVFG